jgi:fermentation-respiration switch protein FrsA (DUF1100 family)
MRQRATTWPIILILLLLVAGIYFGLCAYARQLIYAPSSYVPRTPVNVGLLHDDVFLSTSDGTTINGWFVAADVDRRPAPTVLFFHGGTGNMANRLDKLPLFHDLGANVFIIDYRGFGKSLGVPSETGMAQDALAAYFYLVEQRGIAPAELFLFGEGLGAAVAIELTTKVNVAGLITEAAPASVLETVQRDCAYLPLQWLTRDRFDCYSRIGSVRVPVLLIHSTDDEVVAFGEAERIFAAAHEPKELFPIRGNHSAAFLDSFDSYSDKLADFIWHHAPPPKREHEVLGNPVEREPQSDSPQ